MTRPGPVTRATIDASGEHTWHAAPRLARLATAALAGLLVAIISGRPDLLLLAAPVLAVLAVAGGRPARPELTAEAQVSATSCFEGEDIEVRLALRTGQPPDRMTAEFSPGPTVVLAHGQPRLAVPGGGVDARWTIRPAAWGRRTPGQVRVSLVSGGIWRAELELPLPALEVYPQPPLARPWVVPAELRRRIGEHATRAVGSGVEFAGIREFAPGDRLRDVNWPVSSRRRRLHVNERAAERAADLVVMVDAFSDVGSPGDTTIDNAVRGAAAVARAYLRVGDRVGVVALGGLLRWLGPQPGARQFYRIVEAMFDIRMDSYVSPELDRVPRTALPPGTLVLLFSPLLDERALVAVADLRDRGFSVMVVDVLRHEPRSPMRTRSVPLALRLWRLDRLARRVELSRLGVAVLRWEANDELDAGLAALAAGQHGSAAAMAAAAGALARAS